MLELDVLDEYAGLIDSLGTEKVQEQLTKTNDRWIFDRFARGYESSDTLRYDPEIVLLPTSEGIDPPTISLCKTGIEDLFLQPTGLQFNVRVSDTDPAIARKVIGKREEKNGETSIEHPWLSYNKLKKNGAPMSSYILFIDDADFFLNEGPGVGYADTPGFGAGTVLTRAYTKGRYKKGKFLQWSEDKRKQYMKQVSAHEINHTVGVHDDKELESHGQMGVPDQKDCLGYSQNIVPAKMCEGCIDSVRAYWYGRQLRTGKSLLSRTVPNQKKKLQKMNNKDIITPSLSTSYTG